MANGIRKRTRSERVAAVEMPPGVMGRTFGYLRQGHILVRIGLCVLASIVLWAVTQAWSPPLSYYEGYVPARDIDASIAFDQPDPEATEKAKREAGELAFAVYSNDDKQLIQLRARLMNTVNKVLGAETVEAVGTDEWSRFLPPVESKPPAPVEPEAKKKTEDSQVRLRVPAAQSLSTQTKSLFRQVSDKKTKNVGLLQPASTAGGAKNDSTPVNDSTAEEKSLATEKNAVADADKESEPQADKSNSTDETSDGVNSTTAEVPDEEVPDAAAPAKPVADGTTDSKAPAGESSDDKSPVDKAATEESPAKDPEKEQKEEPAKVDPATERFLQFKAAMAKPDAVEKLQRDIEEAFRPLEKHGILEKLPDEHRGNQERVLVYPHGDPRLPEPVSISDVLAANASAALQERIKQEIESPIVAESIARWLKDQLPNTLVLDPVETKSYREDKENAVPPQMKHFAAGTVLALADKPIDEKQLALLQLEHQQLLAQRSFVDKAGRSLAAMGMYLALYTLCGFYIYRREPELILSLPRLSTILCVVVGTIALAVILKDWHAELVPLLLFSMAIAIAYHQELALLLSAAVMLVVVTALGRDLTSGIVLLAATYGAILLLRNVRTRTKLLFVGIGSGAVALFTTVGMGNLMGQPWSELLKSGLLSFGLCVLAGSLMTVLLPFIERAFGVLTDISLLELGDAAHPLLQELIRRAPGTYNHSITVALLAEAAAEAIGARGLVVRVGAFFHDIGKMLKPGYFIENQGQGGNRHESLVPAMSTLVIIAHVKDGADLARQNRLPEKVIDFIQQHHGTTLVEYFYRRANEQKEAEAEGGEVDESSFRYPGPKPQTKEAGVLMLADAVESASRVLVEPTPARIESLVEEITMKRLLDGQFDECGLTLQEVHIIGESLVKSLTGVYHGRVKYPGQQTA